MELDKVVSISGKPGLYKIIAETHNKIIVQSLEDAKKKLPVGSNLQVAMLDKITIFTVDESDLGVQEVLESIDKYAEEHEIPNPKTGNPDEIRDFFTAVALKHDPRRVHLSDIKKIIKWYHLLKKQE